jgi:hypothetical protein
MDPIKSIFAKVFLVMGVAVLFSMIPTSASATTYYLSASGSDSNSGTSASAPWLSPNHSVNCGDQIIAAASTSYSTSNFAFGHWGAVTGSGHCVAWLICATFDACKISSTSGPAMGISASHWGVMGWEATSSGSTYPCFEAFASGGSTIRDIIFANDIANGCYGSGFTQPPNGSVGVDYFVVIASIAYNAAKESSECTSGFNSWEPVNYDTAPGTHIFYSQDFAWGSVDPNPCAGTAPTDGEGFIFDTWDHSDTTNIPYTGQGVMENNISFFNGSSGLRVDITTHAPVYIVNNTSYGNNGGPGLNSSWCGEIITQQSTGVIEYNNIARTNSSTGCGSNPNYAYYLAVPNSTNQVYSNVGYSASGYNSSTSSASGFSFGSGNVFGTDPSFVSAPSSVPGPPSCSGASSVINCMAPIIADFRAQASQASGMGYQPVSNTPNSDPLFPQWLCTVNLPAGLVTMGCGADGPAPPTALTIQVQ